MTTGCLSRREKSNQIRESDRLYLVNIYRAQHLLHLLSSRLQVVTIMDGAVMGSGVLFGLNATHSVVTERTYWGLPEVGSRGTKHSVHDNIEVSIAGMPDVGTLYHMLRLEDNLGKMLFLTGSRLKGSQLVPAGLASHFCPSGELGGLRREILGTGGDSARLGETLGKYQGEARADSEAVEFVEELKENCATAYISDDLLEIKENLSQLDTDWGRAQLAALSRGCPLSLR